MFCVTPLGEDAYKLVPNFLWILSHPPFLFSDCALYPFAVINHSGEYNYMLSPPSLLSKS